MDYGYTTTDGMPASKSMDGLLSTDRDINPNFYDWNAATIIYCSSDYFTGTVAANENASMHFLGHTILDAALSDIFALTELKEATEIMIVGQGAGGFSVLLGIDTIQQHLTVSGVHPDTDVRVVVDSAWWMYVEPYQSVECSNNPTVCTMQQKVEEAWDHWKPILPNRCSDYDLTWECFYGYLSNIHLFPYPLFVFEWGYESGQFISVGVYSSASSISESEEDFIESYKAEKAQSLEDLVEGVADTGYFFPSCWDHEILLNENFAAIDIEGVQLQDALATWMGYPDVCDGIDCNPSCPANN